MNKKHSKDLLKYNLKRCKILKTIKEYNKINKISYDMLVLLEQKKEILNHEVFNYYYNEFYYFFDISAKEIVDK